MTFLSDQQLLEAIEVISSSGHMADDALEDTLNQTFSNVQAFWLLRLVPIIYCRIWFAKDGPKFKEQFRVTSLVTGKIEHYHFHDNPIWERLYTLAYKDVVKRQGQDRLDRLISLAGRSAEFACLNDLMNQGSRLQDIQLVENVFISKEKAPTY